MTIVTECYCEPAMIMNINFRTGAADDSVLHGVSVHRGVLSVQVCSVIGGRGAMLVTVTVRPADCQSVCMRMFTQHAASNL